MGIVSGGVALYYVPVVDQHREQSMISVSPNGGNTEVFHVNVPIDRIMIGTPDSSAPLPAGLQWPDSPELAGLRAELFKIRNGKDAVVGVASRVAARTEEDVDLIEWVLHLPARGSIYITMQPDAVEGGYRQGIYRAGTRDFADLIGRVTERWIADTSGSEDAPAGRIELLTAFVATQDALDEPLEESIQEEGE